jgi:hypothetical protein
MSNGKKDTKQPPTAVGHLRVAQEGNPSHAAGNSSSWSSPRTLEGARLARLQNLANHLGFSHSPFFPKNIGQYAQHLQEYNAEKIKVEQDRINRRISQIKTVDEFGKQFKCHKFLNGRILEFKRPDPKGVKMERTWPYGITKEDNGEPLRQIGWPTMVELKFEGEHRAKKGLRRQLPVPKRKVDEETAVRLMNMGMKIEMALELLYAEEDEVGAMLKDALEYCGVDELQWKQIEADLIKAEKEEQDRSRGGRKEAELGRDGWWYLQEQVPVEEHKFDEEDLKCYGMWAELLHEINKN